MFRTATIVILLANVLLCPIHCLFCDAAAEMAVSNQAPGCGCCTEDASNETPNDSSDEPTSNPSQDCGDCFCTGAIPALSLVSGLAAGDSVWSFDTCWGNHPSKQRHASEIPEPWMTLRCVGGSNWQTALQTWLI